MKPIPRTASGGVNHVHALRFHFHFHAAAGQGFAGFRHKHFGQHDGGRRRHDDGRQQVRDGDVRDGNISGHHRARHMGHAAHHHGEQFRFCQGGEKRPNGDRRFRLSHDNAGRYASGLGAAGAHELLHEHRHAFHEDLHHAEVVQNRKQRADEDNDGQHLKREYHAELRRWKPQFVAEDEARTLARVTEQLVHKQADAVEDSAETGLQHNEREREL
jgi:hypothetical protein